MHGCRRYTDLHPIESEGHNCEASVISSYVNPFNEAIFDFGLTADMGTGADTAYGTGNDDVLYSNKPGTIIPFLTAAGFRGNVPAETLRSRG